MRLHFFLCLLVLVASARTAAAGDAVTSSAAA